MFEDDELSGECSSECEDEVEIGNRYWESSEVIQGPVPKSVKGRLQKHLDY